jgi:hypothetical protein
LLTVTSDGKRPCPELTGVVLVPTPKTPSVLVKEEDPGETTLDAVVTTTVPNMHQHWDLLPDWNAELTNTYSKLLQLTLHLEPMLQSTLLSAHGVLLKSGDASTTNKSNVAVDGDAAGEDAADRALGLGNGLSTTVLSDTEVSMTVDQLCTKDCAKDVHVTQETGEAGTDKLLITALAQRLALLNEMRQSNRSCIRRFPIPHREKHQGISQIVQRL